LIDRRSFAPLQWRFVCDRYVVKLEGESPLRALVRRTVSEGKGVHCEMESEESRIQNAGLTNRYSGNGRRI
jgi:hypothetical protein